MHSSPPVRELCRKGGTIESVSPIRTCVGCGERDNAENLIRVAVKMGRLVLDPQRRMPGRGAWLHGSDCLVKASRRRAFERAFRMRADSSGLADQFRLVATWADGPRPTESGLEADGHPMSTQR